MTASSSTYAVGRGKPPLHIRFKKGQSGNPSGKPGPAKLAKQRFQRALYAALEGSEEELALSKPDNLLTGIARRLVLDAVAGRMSALKQVLSLLDTESGKKPEDDTAEQLFTAAELFSLLQGKNQGSEEISLEDILWPEAREKAAQMDVRACEESSRESVPTAVAPSRNETEPLSLVQGKTQGNGKNSAAFPVRNDKAVGSSKAGDCYLPVPANALMAASGGP